MVEMTEPSHGKEHSKELLRRLTRPSAWRAGTSRSGEQWNEFLGRAAGCGGRWVQGLG